jgi:hypothetical protein
MSKPNYVEIDVFADTTQLPEGVHDVFFLGGETRAYLKALDGERIIRLGDHIVRHKNGSIDIMDEEDVNRLFIKDE